MCVIELLVIEEGSQMLRSVKRKSNWLFILSMIALPYAVDLVQPAYATGDEYKDLNRDLAKMTASEQLRTLWNEIKKTNYKNNLVTNRSWWGWFSGKTITGLPTSERNAISALWALNTKKDAATIFNPEMGPFPPKDYQKPTHYLGVVAQVRFEVENTKYTGQFRQGGRGLMRLSKIGHSRGPFGPSMSMMMLEDYAKPTSFNVMHSVDGQGQDPHFFAHSFSNFPGPAKKIPASLIIENFNQVAEDISASSGQQVTYNNLPGIRTEKTRVAVLPLIDHARIENGKPVENPLAPFEVIFKPYPEVEIAFNRELESAKDSGADYRDFIQKVARKGQVVFLVYARDEEAAKRAWVKKWGDYDSASLKEQSSEGEDVDGVPVESTLIGQVVLESDFIASEFGDRMRFIHSPQTVLLDI